MGVVLQYVILIVIFVAVKEPCHYYYCTASLLYISVFALQQCTENDWSTTSMIVVAKVSSCENNNSKDILFWLDTGHWGQ